MSPKDSSTIAVICAYPDIDDNELNMLLESLETEKSKRICRSIVRNEPILPEDEDDTHRLRCWRNNKQMRIRNEQRNARYKSNETSMAARLKKLNQEGKISDQALLLYGISGNLPERDMYANWDADEREKYWQDRYLSRMGTCWKETIVRQGPEKVAWAKEGF
jgi:hypothetical protein